MLIVNGSYPKLGVILDLDFSWIDDFSFTGHCFVRARQIRLQRLQAFPGLPGEDGLHHRLYKEPEEPRLGPKMKLVSDLRLVRREVLVVDGRRPSSEEWGCINHLDSCQRRALKGYVSSLEGDASQ